MKSIIQKYSVMIFAAAVFFLQGFSMAAQPVSISVATSQPGTALSENALGLSYETKLLLADKDGSHYFRPDNKPLLTMFRTLGIKNLRIGGNSVDAVDANDIPIPTIADVQSLFEFARAAKVKVIYSFRLKDGDPNSAAKLAKVIGDKYGDVLESFAIGNEPSYYKAKAYDEYWPRWKAIHDAIAAVYPKARFSGPDQNPNAALFKKTAELLGNETEGLIQITAHSYPFGCSYKKHSKKIDPSQYIPFEAGACREKMLSPEAYAKYEQIFKGLNAAVSGTSLSFRLSETNSYWLSGLEGASDSFAASLWALDYLCWWTARGAAGLDFHTGDMTGGKSMAAHYAVFVTAAGGYQARPLAYGMKMFDLSGHGRSLTTSVKGGSKTLAAYAALGDDKTVLITIINKQFTKDAPNTEIQIRLDCPADANKGEVIFLRAKGNDIAAGSADVTVGDSVIQKDGAWHGQWQPVSISAKDAAINLSLPAASAAVVRVKLK